MSSITRAERKQLSLDLVKGHARQLDELFMAYFRVKNARTVADAEKHLKTMDAALKEAFMKRHGKEFMKHQEETKDDVCEDAECPYCLAYFDAYDDDDDEEEENTEPATPHLVTPPLKLSQLKTEIGPIAPRWSNEAHADMFMARLTALPVQMECFRMGVDVTPDVPMTDLPQYAAIELD